MRKIFLLLISLFVGIFVFFFIGRTIGWREIKNAFLVFTGWQGLIILILTLLMMLIGNWKWKEILKGEGVDVSFWNLFKPYLAGFSIMFLAPILLLGGEVVRGYILKNRNSIVWSKGMASVLIERILEWTVNLLVIFSGLLFFLLMIDLPPRNLTILMSSLFLFFTIGIFIFYLKILKKESLISFFSRWFRLKFLNQKNSFLEIEKEIFAFFRTQNKKLWQVLGLTFLRAGVMWSRTWFLILFLGKNIGALPSLSILGFTYLIAMIPIPTALGSHEAIQIFAFNSLGMNPFVATAFTLIIRGAELIFALIGAIIIFRLGMVILNQYFTNKNHI